MERDTWITIALAILLVVSLLQTYQLANIKAQPTGAATVNTQQQYPAPQPVYRSEPQYPASYPTRTAR